MALIICSFLRICTETNKQTKPTILSWKTYKFTEKKKSENPTLTDEHKYCCTKMAELWLPVLFQKLDSKKTSQLERH